jgi:hypothetical protein
MNEERGHAANRQVLSDSLLDKRRAAYFRDARKEPGKEGDQSPANSCILRCTLSRNHKNCGAIHLVPNQPRAGTNERCQGRFD